jgi:glycosyltransferase involved in cell wall biosynthesis
MASAFSPEKRVPDGVRAVARVPEAFLVLVGDGPQRWGVAALLEELLPGRHLLLGSVPRSRMPSIYRRSDVLLHMRQDEPFGIVYLEAASTGLAVVAHDAPDPRWILGETALYADTSDLDAVADALRRAARPETKRALGEAARRRVERDWTWCRQARRYREFFEGVAADRRGRGPRGRSRVSNKVESESLTGSRA